MNNIPQSELDDFKKASTLFRAINNKLRQRILDSIWNKRKTVTEIYIELRIEQSVASQHLAILRQAKLVKTDRNGKYIHYSVDKLNIENLKSVTTLIICNSL